MFCFADSGSMHSSEGPSGEKWSRRYTYFGSMAAFNTRGFVLMLSQCLVKFFLKTTPQLILEMF